MGLFPDSEIDPNSQWDCAVCNGKNVHWSAPASASDLSGTLLGKVRFLLGGGGGGGGGGWGFLGVLSFLKS